MTSNTTSHLNNHDAEWELLKAIVIAGNARDTAEICRLVNSPKNNILNKPRCISAALSGITLVLSHIAPHTEALSRFLSLLGDTPLDLRSTYRKEMLRALLQELADTPAPVDQNTINNTGGALHE